MSILVQLYLYCDDPTCGVEPFRVDFIPGETRRDLRATAKRDGWRYRKGKDFCPLCATPAVRGERKP